MHYSHWAVHAFFLTDLVIRLSLSARVIKPRLPVGVSLPWVVVILIFPFVGAIFSLLVGEYRLGRRRARRAAAYRERQAEQLSRVKGADQAARTIGPGGTAVARLAESALGAAVLTGNRLELWKTPTPRFRC